jgi:putative ABC transport system ATP-binding protein
MISVKNLTKFFPIKHKIANKEQDFDKLTVIKNVSFEISKGTWTSLMGPSGSGKSTLLSLLAGLESPNIGKIEINGQELTTMNEDQKAKFRAQQMGFVFQSFRLIPTLTAYENICVPLELNNSLDEQWVSSLLSRVGLKDRADHYPGQLSGGEQQRIAVARAFATKPKILFADEPTGNLDSRNGEEVLKLMKQMQEENHSTLIVVTHDPNVAKLGNRLIQLKDGEIISQ